MSAVFALDDITNICTGTSVSDDHSLLLQKIKRVYPQFDFVHVLTRGGWHRIGGVLDASGKSLAKNLPDWLEQESGGNLDTLLDQYLDAGFKVSLLRGATHYFVAQTGDLARQFVQLEVESLREVVDRQLFDINNPPDDFSDIIEPLHPLRLEPSALGDAFYDFRRMTDIDQFIVSMQQQDASHEKKPSEKLLRFMQDWDRSSARESGAFCLHWVLGLQEYTDPWGESVKRAKPASVFDGDLTQPAMNPDLRGVELARLIHAFDHLVGYPMAWYFFMLSRPEVPYQLADAIHRDLMGAYDYLPARDLKIIKDWSAKPYAV